MNALHRSVVPMFLLGVATTMALASEPVSRVIEGCVRGGVFTSRDNYEIRPQQRLGEPVELTSFEGRIVVLDGDLLPGDLMILNKPPQHNGPCAQ